MISTTQLLIVCGTFVAHAVADPEVIKLMGKAFAPAIPVARPMSSAQLPAISGGTAGHAFLRDHSDPAVLQVREFKRYGDPGSLESIEGEVAQLEDENLAMKSEIQQVRSKIASASVPQSHAKRALFASLEFMGIFGFGIVFGASLMGASAAGRRGTCVMLEEGNTPSQLSAAERAARDAEDLKRQAAALQEEVDALQKERNVKKEEDAIDLNAELKKELEKRATPEWQAEQQRQDMEKAKRQAELKLRSAQNEMGNLLYKGPAFWLGVLLGISILSALFGRLGG